MAKSTRKSSTEVPGNANPEIWDWYATWNPRRLDLIDKKDREGLTDSESAELAGLMEEMELVAGQATPRPTVELDRILARIGRTEG